MATAQLRSVWDTFRDPQPKFDFDNPNFDIVRSGPINRAQVNFTRWMSFIVGTCVTYPFLAGNIWCAAHIRRPGALAMCIGMGAAVYIPPIISRHSQWGRDPFGPWGDLSRSPFRAYRSLSPLKRIE